MLAMVLCGIIIYGTQDKLRYKWSKAVVIMVALLMVVGIGVSKLYLGMHHPSDVAAGHFVGVAWLASVIGSDVWVEVDDRRRVTSTRDCDRRCGNRRNLHLRAGHTVIIPCHK